MLDELPRPHRVPKGEYERAQGTLRVDLINAQFELRNRDFPVIVLVAGDDRVAVNESVQLLHDWMDARFLVTRVFTEPTEEERQRPLFWRYWRALPARGKVGVHVGSWAAAVVRDRLERHLDAGAFAGRLAHIRQFEAELVADGALLLKFWLHLDRKALERRIRRFPGADDEAWQVEKSDRQMLRRYGETMALVEDMLAATHTAQAPWLAIPDGNKRHRNLALATALRDALARHLRERRRRRAATPPTRPPVPDALARVDLSRRYATAAGYDRMRKRWQAELGRLTRQARDSGISSVLVFEGWDAAGKGGAIRRLTRAMSVRDYRVVPVGVPTDEENRYHYLWRFWRHLPGAGQMLIFDRSWYGRVLVERVEGFARPDEWERAYQEIADFESQLVEHGIRLCKFWLHIDEEEQLRRFEARQQTEYKKYKITAEDFRNREQWQPYVEAVNEMVAQTSTRQAPWTLVPANDKRWARVQVLKTVCTALAQ
jgi:polyphosphate:AMP phosphotransferase